MSTVRELVYLNHVTTTTFLGSPSYWHDLLPFVPWHPSISGVNSSSSPTLSLSLWLCLISAVKGLGLHSFKAHCCWLTVSWECERVIILHYCFAFIWQNVSRCCIMSNGRITEKGIASATQVPCRRQNSLSVFVLLPVSSWEKQWQRICWLKTGDEKSHVW